ncbi:MAG: hypothetical protein HN669_10250 [Candidatus Marinimicrobia bacterium]|jgi:hypothetical protein|nr:hypothetical protein [Candidatus Neomarinimicrobiota bacterium]
MMTNKELELIYASIARRHGAFSPVLGPVEYDFAIEIEDRSVKECADTIRKLGILAIKHVMTDDKDWPELCRLVNTLEVNSDLHNRKWSLLNGY